MDYYKLKVLNHKKLFGTILVLIVITLIISYYLYFRNDDVEVLSKSEENITNDEIVISKQIFVDIKGYVVKPGVYSFFIDDNARINDLIIKAGGLKKEADTSTINLSKKLEDEMSIIIYSKSEINNYLKTLQEMERKLELCELNLRNNACLNDEKVSNQKENKINLNTASMEELTSLSGIGIEKAKSIIDYRNKKKFEKIEELKDVSGIGDSMFEKIKDHITV